MTLTKRDILAIKVQITDGEALRRIRPERLEAYLLQNGWTTGDPNAFKLTHFFIAPEGSRVMGIPLDSEPRYATRIQETLTHLASYEKRSQLAIYVDILAAPLSVEEAQSEDGSEVEQS